jgi:hypothetical protein
MKRGSLVLAISVLALTAAAEPLFAAESETAAPQEQAAPAPARERAAPSARRAQPAHAPPARVQQAAPQQQAVQPSQTSSYTGAQAGGFGGGNVGGGGFADPICLNDTGGLSNGCTPALFNHSLNKTGGIGGGVIQYMIPVSPWIVVGIMGDLAGGKTTASSTQSYFYPSDPFSLPSFRTSETYTNSVSQSTNGSIRFKAGVVTPVPGWNSTIMPYFTVGWIRQKFEGTFSYSASNFDSSCPSCGSTIAGSSLSWSHQANGVIFGAGVDIPIPAFGPGIVLTLDYSHASFQSFDITAPVAIGASFGSACIPGPTFVCATSDNLHVSNPRSDRFTAGVRIKFL